MRPLPPFPSSHTNYSSFTENLSPHCPDPSNSKFKWLQQTSDHMQTYENL